MELNEEEAEMRTPEDVAREVEYEFEWRQLWVNFILTLVKRLLGFLFLRVIFK